MLPTLENAAPHSRVRARRMRPLRPACRVHSASAGVLGVGAVPGAPDALLTQGRDGTLKRWQARRVLRKSGRRGFALKRVRFALCSSCQTVL